MAELKMHELNSVIVEGKLNKKCLNLTAVF